ncbi:MAG TPA: tryptophan synthase subunit alpha [Allosphingosinicella sp.]|jgi:tryptophan synthase alpha chain
MSRYDAMFDRLAERGECAFGAFAMLGDPDLEASAAILDALVEGGADMLEVGIPFSDPVADGPVIQAAAVRALRGGTRTADCFRILGEFRRRHPQVPVGILTYANLVVARGREAFYRAAAEAGVDSVLVADVPMTEAEPFLSAAREAGVAPVLIAAPNTPPSTLERIARAGEGYTYCVARSGVTGADREVKFEAEVIAALRALGAPPCVLGFGIARPEHVRLACRAGAAGVISGSAIVSLIASNPGGGAAAVRDFVREMKAATRA